MPRPTSGVLREIEAFAAEGMRIAAADIDPGALAATAAIITSAHPDTEVLTRVTDVADAVFDRLWASEDVTWADIVAACAETTAGRA